MTDSSNNANFYAHLNDQIEQVKEDGLYKAERVITTAQQPNIAVTTGEAVVNFCANNYLGLSDDDEVIKAASDCLQERGFGMSSVRFICGTQDIHKQLETNISEFLGFEDTILYSSCFDANGGLFEVLLTAEDAIISDALNHASIIDGVRLCKASRYRYKNNDMADLEENLKAARAAGARRILITTDGVFSMDGTVAQLDAICDLADQYGAMVHHDDCHATGFMGVTGRGVHEHCGVMSRVDIITGTFGKALGGGSGGFTAGRQEIIDILRQRSRPYLFSNTLAPAICAASLKVLDMLEASTALRDTLHSNTQYFREQMQAHGFAVPAGDHPIVPVMLGDAVVAQRMSERLLELGIYAVGFFYPVVPKGKARIRVQISAGHTKDDLDRAVAAFSQAQQEIAA